MFTTAHQGALPRAWPAETTQHKAAVVAAIASMRRMIVAPVPRSPVRMIAHRRGEISPAAEGGAIVVAVAGAPARYHAQLDAVDQRGALGLGGSQVLAGLLERAAVRAEQHDAAEDGAERRQQRQRI